MDPQLAAHRAADTTQPLDERAEHAQALLGWLRQGGYVPQWPGRPSFGGTGFARQWTIEACEQLLRTAQA